MSEFHYVYVLVSKTKPDRHYTGCTSDLEQRIKDHNRGHVPHTSKFAPWEIKIAIAFKDKPRQPLLNATSNPALEGSLPGAISDPL